MLLGWAVQAQGDPTPGDFIGEPAVVACGTIAYPIAKVNYKFRAMNYQEARTIAESIRWRFENLYRQQPSYLREYYVCKSRTCKGEPPCWAEAKVSSVRAVRLTEIARGGYLLQMHVNYKVHCFSCE